MNAFLTFKSQKLFCNLLLGYLWDEDIANDKKHISEAKGWLVPESYDPEMKARLAFIRKIYLSTLECMVVENQIGYSK